MRTAKVILLTALAVCGCATHSRRLLRTKQAEDQYCEMDSDFVVAGNHVIVVGAAGWLYFYDLKQNMFGFGKADKRFREFVNKLDAAILQKVMLYETPTHYEIVVQTKGPISDALKNGRLFYALSVELFGNKAPLFKTQRKEEILSFLYTSPDMRNALLLVGDLGGVLAEKVKQPIWKHKLRLIAKLPVNVEGNTAVFCIPKKLLTPNAVIEDVWARTHVLIEPAQPLRCEIRDLLFLPAVDCLYTLEGCVYENFAIPWQFGPFWHEATPLTR